MAKEKTKNGAFEIIMFAIEDGDGSLLHAGTIDKLLEDTDYDETYSVAEYKLVSVKKFKRQTVAVEVK